MTGGQAAAPPSGGYAARAPFYEVETDVSGADQPFLRSLLDAPVRTVLEVPCGAGRNAGWLAASGRTVVLADLEHEMLLRSRERARDLGPAAAPLRFVRGDLRALPFAGAFDLVLVPAEALQLVHGREAVRALESVCRALAPRGRAVVDVYAFPGRSDGADGTGPDYYDPSVPDGVAVDEWTRPLPGGGRLSRRRTQRHEPSFVEFEFAYRITGAAATGTRARMRLERYSAAKLLSRAAAAGLEPEQVLASYDRRAHTGVEPRAIALLRRREPR